MNYKLIEFHVFGDNRGHLVSLEEERTVPYKIKRMYYIYGTKAGVERGRHAHTHLKQVIICVKGSCTFILDDGVKRKELKLCYIKKTSLIIIKNGISISKERH